MGGDVRIFFSVMAFLFSIKIKVQCYIYIEKFRLPTY